MLICCSGHRCLVACRLVLEGKGRTLEVRGQAGQPTRLLDTIARHERSEASTGANKLDARHRDDPEFPLQEVQPRQNGSADSQRLKPWADHGHAAQTAASQAAMKRTAEQVLYRERTTGFEPATLTLARKNVKRTVRRVRPVPRRGLLPADSSAQPVQSAHSVYRSTIALAQRRLSVCSNLGHHIGVQNKSCGHPRGS
jgi:hypothetical protein